MIQTAQEVLAQAKERIGMLAKRSNDPVLAASDDDNPILEGYLGDALREVATRTDRLETTTTPETVASQPHVPRPPHVDVIQEAYVYDSGTAYEMKIYDGGETARAAQAPDAESGRPTLIGDHGGKLWLHPVPDDQYELALTCTMNGEHGDSSPADDTEPPTLDGLMEQVPAELTRAVVAYVVAEWFEQSGEIEIAEADRARFERDLRKYGTKPNRQRTHQRPYMPLGGALS